MGCLFTGAKRTVNDTHTGIANTSPSCYTARMHIHKGATQQELETAAAQYARKLYKEVMQLSLRAQIVIIFLCLLIPPSIFGFFMIGAVLSALFFCFAFWAYSNNEPQLLQNALMWWYIWAGGVYLLNFLLRGILCRRLAAQLKLYKEAEATDATPIPTPLNYPISWHQDEEAKHWQNIVLFQAPARGLYAFELIIEDFDGSLDATPDFACAVHMEEIPGDRIRYLAIYRLEAGPHWLPHALSHANGSTGPKATLSLLSELPQ